MPVFVSQDRVKVTSTSTGTGTFTLGAAVTGFSDFSVIGNGNKTYYAITTDIEWEVGIGTYTSSGTTLSRDIVLSSSNSGNLVNFPAGTKEVFTTQAAVSTQGTTPISDNNSITTNEVAWENFRKTLNNNSNAGACFTYTQHPSQELYAFGPNYYIGAVRSPNGNIYFVPHNAASVARITQSGQYVTFSPPFGSNTSDAFAGGVLDPNGNVHFVPYSSRIGFQINPNGAQLTYSLVYTTTGAYFGGVLAPNGEIHFVPYAGNRGQKVSSAGTVSTYTLAYTTAAGAYQGGVLAPNGDIHFIPYNAVVGQKISAAGVVSTYSLAYTASSAYSGGVISVDGDIHFVPFRADVGQKISRSGVVSTYALANTTTYVSGGGYSGGVLAPNGDIHLVPSSATVGQKINRYGVMSTYTVTYALSACAGGILDSDGNVVFVNRLGTSSFKIFTGCASPFDINTLLSPYLNKF